MGRPHCTSKVFLGSKVHPQTTTWILFLKNYVSLTLAIIFAWHCLGISSALPYPVVHRQKDFYDRNNLYLRQHHSEAVKMRKPEALVGAFRNTGVFLSSFQLLPAVNAGVNTSDMPIYPRGTYHPSLLLPSIRLLHPDHGSQGELFASPRTGSSPQDTGSLALWCQVGWIFAGSE